MLKKDVDVLDGPLFRNMWRFTYPVITMGMLSRLHNVADMLSDIRFTDDCFCPATAFSVCSRRNGCH